MKLRIMTFLVVMAFLAAVVQPTQCVAQKNTKQLPHYTVVDLGTLGGSYSLVWSGASNSGWIVGDSGLPNDTADNAFLWHYGRMIDLGTLGGPNSYGVGTNDWGDAVGAAETSSIDPLQEEFCYPDGFVCLPFVWQNQRQTMTALPTLGGTNGAAWVINDQGVIVGQAENTKLDPTCVGAGSPQVLQIRATMWTNGKVHELPLIKGDNLGAGLGINDWGQSVGVSGPGYCSPLSHAVLWQNGNVIDLGNLGGTSSNEAEDINDFGQVVGVSAVSDDTTVHGFLWWSGGLTDLGTLSGDSWSQGNSINLMGQIVGTSGDNNGNERAFFWQNGVMTDLNTLIPDDSPFYLLEAHKINVWGQITGIGLQLSTGDEHAFLAVPSWSKETTGTTPERPKITLPENARKLLQRRARLGRFRGGLIEPQ
jgi:probable HAF family extracellular repeat protein